jgi:hypothetical protein
MKTAAHTNQPPTVTIKNPELVDAVMMAREHPEQIFWHTRRRRTLRLRDEAVVSTVSGERLVVQITERRSGSYVGRVTNHLDAVVSYGLAKGDIVHFEPRHVHHARRGGEWLAR